jgi:hypothetical protein
MVGYLPASVRRWQAGKIRTRANESGKVCMALRNTEIFWLTKVDKLIIVYSPNKVRSMTIYQSQSVIAQFRFWMAGQTFDFHGALQRPSIPQTSKIELLRRSILLKAGRTICDQLTKIYQ